MEAAPHQDMSPGVSRFSVDEFQSASPLHPPPSAVPVEVTAERVVTATVPDALPPHSTSAGASSTSTPASPTREKSGVASSSARIVGCTAR